MGNQWATQQTKATATVVVPNTSLSQSVSCSGGPYPHPFTASLLQWWSLTHTPFQVSQLQWWSLTPPPHHSQPVSYSGDQSLTPTLSQPVEVKAVSLLPGCWHQRLVEEQDPPWQPHLCVWQLHLACGGRGSPL